MKNLMQFKNSHYQFKPSLVGTLATLICIPLFVNFGLWQYDKAQKKIAIQAIYNQAKVHDILNFPVIEQHQKSFNIEGWKYKKVKLTGVYEAKYQFLLDNQVEQSRVGYHVITPLKIENSSEYVLINRGWILGLDQHASQPKFDTPSEVVTIIGQAWVPSKKIFTLEKTDNTVKSDKSTWQAVWQNINMDQYRRSVPFEVSDIVVKLDPESDAGGFIRNWQVPADRITTHLGYAYQWFGFALSTLLIYLYMSFSRIKSASIS